MFKNKFSMCILLCFVSSPCVALDLGQGFDTETGAPKQICLEGERVYAGAAEGTLMFSFQDHYDAKQTKASGEVSGGIGGGLLGVSSETSVEYDSVKKMHRLKFYQVYDIETKTERLSSYNFTDLGRLAYQAVPLRYLRNYWLWPGFTKICGDAFVTHLRRGGRVIFEVAILSDVAFTETKTVKEYTVKLLFKKIKRKKTQTHREMQKSEHISIRAHQFGGDTEIFEQKFKKDILCNHEHPDSCWDRIEELMDYLTTDSEEGFKQQIRSKPEVLGIESMTYDNVGFIFY